MEQAVLGSMLVERAAVDKAASVLAGEDFYRDAHRLIFEAIRSLHSKDEPVDILSVQGALEAQGILEAVGGFPYLIQLTEAVATAANVDYYARVVQDKATLRRLISTAGTIEAMAYTQIDTVDQIVETAEKNIFAVAQRRVSQDFKKMFDLMHTVAEELEVRANSDSQTTGLPTPYRDLDFMTTGLQKSDLIILAARPSMGKTALALNIAQHAAIRCDVPVAIFSLEMSAQQLAMRMICSEALVEARRLRTGDLTEDDWPRVGRASESIAGSSIFVDESPDCSVLEMRTRCRRLVAQNPNLGLIVVDYLQLMRAARATDNRVQEIGEIARGLKSLARELEIPVIALSQLSRAVEQRQDKRPMLSDLRESGSIEAEADLVMFIYRPEYYKMKEAMSAESSAAASQLRRERGEHKVEQAELIIAKQRNGPTGKIMLAFQPEYARFGHLESELEPD